MNSSNKNAYRILSASSAAALVLAALIFIMPVHGEAELIDGLLRLHIIAESDSDFDQRVKIAVRDAVAPMVYKAVADAENDDRAAGENGMSGSERASAAVAGIMEELTAAAEAVASEYGADYGASASLTRERYPERVYINDAPEGGGDATTITLPEGEYASLRIILGDGGGGNWWCVLFPPICRSAALGAEPFGADDFIMAGFTPQQYGMITGGEAKYKVRFKILDIIKNLFS